MLPTYSRGNICSGFEHTNLPKDQKRGLYSHKVTGSRTKDNLNTLLKIKKKRLFKNYFILKEAAF